MGMNKRINIPAEWQEVKLENSGLKVIDGDRGKKYPNGNDFSNSGYCLFMNAGNVTSSGFLFKENIFITKEKDEELRKGKLKRGDLVLTTRGSIGNIAYYDKNILFDHLRINSGMVIIRNSDRYIDTDFIYKLFRSPKFLKQINKISFGSAQPQLTVSDINKLKILLPPLQEQKAIADILEKWDEAIEKTSKLIDAKRKKFEWLLNNLIKKQQGYEYESLKLVDCCKKITTGKLDANAMVKNGKYRFYTCAKEHYFIDDYKFDGEALLVSGNGANVGYIHYYKGKFNAYQRTYVLMNFYKNIHYIKYCLDKNLSKRINAQVNGGNTPYIKLETISEMMIEIPNSKILQENIVNTLNTAKKEITILEEILAKYKNQKKGLMQNLLTGKIRVNNMNFRN
jgi:type I restriction enzyme S subunit